MKAVFVNGNMEQDIKQEIAQAVMGRVPYQTRSLLSGKRS